MPRRGMTMPRRGMTLAELLIAMLILLVGIYAVAKGFPTLFLQVAADADRTAMSRLAERTVSMLKANSDSVPEATFGYDYVGLGLILPDQEPRDPDEVNYALNPPNTRDDIVHVVGERITVPAPYANAAGAIDQTVAVPLTQGLLRTDPNAASNPPADVSVYQLVPLTRTDEAPSTPGGNTPPGVFYIDPATGAVALPNQVQLQPAGALQPVLNPEAVIDYAWMDTQASTSAWLPAVYVQGERVAHGANVLASRLTSPPIVFGGVIPEECKAWLRITLPFGDALSGANVGYVAGNPQPPVNSFLVEYNYGATLLFNPADQGRRLFVDYAVRTGWPESPQPERRIPMIVEDQQVPAVNQGPPYSTKLSIAGIDDQNSLIEDNMEGLPVNANGQFVHVLAVDLTDGQAYDDASGTLTIDYLNGTVSFPASGPAVLGHVCRFYYRTLEQHDLEILKAPATFLRKCVADLYTGAAGAPSPFDVKYRTYDVIAPDASEPRTRLTFPESSAGQTVSVDYTYGLKPTMPTRVTEVHVVNDGSYQIALDHPNVVSIIAVRGVSVKVRGWWRAQKGKLRHVDVDCCLMPVYATAPAS